MPRKSQKKGRSKARRRAQQDEFSTPPWIEVAQNILQARKKLRHLLDKAATGKTLSDTEKKSAANLRKEILAFKTKLTDMGKDPDIAVGVAMKILENRTKLKRGKYRQSGVGAYGLGSTIKVWR